MPRVRLQSGPGSSRPPGPQTIHDRPDPQFTGTPPETAISTKLDTEDVTAKRLGVLDRLETPTRSRPSLSPVGTGRRLRRGHPAHRPPRSVIPTATRTGGRRMNRNHWSGWSEAELLHMRSARRMRSSRPSRGVTRRQGGRAAARRDSRNQGVTGRVAQEPRTGVPVVAPEGSGFADASRVDAGPPAGHGHTTQRHGPARRARWGRLPGRGSGQPTGLLPSGRVAGRGRIHWLMSSDAAPSVVSARGAR